MTAITAETWPAIRDLGRRTSRTSIAFAVATTCPDGSPHVSPIGSVRLGREPGTAILLELFSKQMSVNLEHDPRVTVLAMDTNGLRFVNALRKGRFERAIATRLVGTAGPKRWATQRELDSFKRSVRPFRRLEGHDLLWNVDRCRARTLTFDNELPVHLGAMTRHLARAAAV